MDAWYEFILNALFSRKKGEKEQDDIDKDNDLIANYIELDSLMQVIYHTNNETEFGN